MMDWLTLHVAALVVTAVLFGGMTLFMTLFAPLAFRNLPRDTAAAFMRSLFPVYFKTMGLVSLVPTVILLPIPSYRPEGGVLAALAVSFFAARYLLLPAMNARRDAGRDRAAAALHRASVVIHLLQWLAAGAVLVRLAA